MAIQNLEHYDMSAARGYLCRHDAGSVSLPGNWTDLANIAMRLPDILSSGQIRSHLEGQLPTAELLNVSELTNP